MSTMTTTMTTAELLNDLKSGAGVINVTVEQSEIQWYVVVDTKISRERFAGDTRDAAIANAHHGWFGFTG